MYTNELSLQMNDELKEASMMAYMLIGRIEQEKIEEKEERLTKTKPTIQTARGFVYGGLISLVLWAIIILLVTFIF